MANADDVARIIEEERKLRARKESALQHRVGIA